MGRIASQCRCTGASDPTRAPPAGRRPARRPARRPCNGRRIGGTTARRPARPRIGDVVTVDRDDELPITHRVTSHEHTRGDSWTITMRGDANPTPDPAPYTVSTVRTVLFSIPGLAVPIAALSSPWVLGGVTLAVSALVVWALWPRARGDEA